MRVLDRGSEPAAQWPGLVAVALTLYMDSDSARSLVTRFGVMKTKHVASKMLWLQELTSRSLLRVRRVGTLDNMSDILTKFVTRKVRESLVPYLLD